MKEVRTIISELEKGDMIVRVGDREVNRRFIEVREVSAGQAVKGPRGGKYKLTAAGAREYVLIATYGGTSNPIVKRNSSVTVLRESE